MNLEKGNNEVELKTRSFCSRIKVLTLLLDMYYDVHISLFPVIKALESVRLNKWKQAVWYMHQYLQVFVCSSHVCEALSLH